MPLTGVLGTTDSQLGNLELGKAGVPGGTVRLIQAKANLFGTTTRTLQAKASIAGTNTRSIQARVRIASFSSLIHDSFNRADSATLGTADSGQTWNTLGGDLYGISSNQANAASTGLGSGTWIESGVTPTAAAPIKVSCDVINAGTGVGTGVIFRSDSLNNRWYCYIQKNAGVYQLLLYRESGGSGFGSPFLQQNLTGVTVNDNETHRLIVIDFGAKVTVWLDDVLQTTFTDTTNNSQTKQGIFFTAGGSADRVDNFNVGQQSSVQTISAKASIVKITRTIQAKANLFNTTAQTVQAKASIHANLQDVTLQARARIQISSAHTIQAQCRIQPTHAGEISARAKISGTSTQTLQAKAKIQVTTTQTISAKANLLMPRVTIQAKAAILNSHLPTIQAKAAVTPQTQQRISAKASLLPGPRRISAKARLRNLVTSILEVDYAVQVPVTAGLLVTYNATLSTETIQSIQAKANVKRGVVTNLSVSFDVCYSMPAPPVIRPTQRTEFRTIRTVTAKARIRTCSVVLIGNTYQTVCT